MSKPLINPALGLDLVAERTLSNKAATVTVLIPAHNEESTVSEVVSESLRGLKLLGVSGEVLVSASGCTDDTAGVATNAGARVIDAPIGKGAALIAGIAEAEGDIICLIDGDLQYFGEPPLVPLLVQPILRGIADACVSDLYWRPLYPELWLYGFFAPLAGVLFPELLPKVGSTPWSGQRAALKELWPTTLPDGFTADLALLLHWNQHATRLRPVLADDWVNPQRPKPDLMSQEFNLLVAEAVRQGRLDEGKMPGLADWFDVAYSEMAKYRPDVDDPQQFERQVLSASTAALQRHMAAAE